MEGTCAVEGEWVGISGGGVPGMHVCWGQGGGTWAAINACMSWI